MGHVKRGDPKGFLQLVNFQTDLEPQLCIQIGQRFVKENHSRFADNGVPHGNPLTLTTGQLPRLSVQQGFTLQKSGDLFDLGVDLGLWHTRDLQTVAHVLAHRHVEVERVIQDHHRDVAVHWKC